MKDETRVPGLTKALLFDGKVLAGVAGEFAPEALALRVGNREAAFGPCSTDVHGLPLFGGTVFFDTEDLAELSASEPPESRPGEIYACWINELHDWVLSGSQTIQVMISRHEAPCVVTFQNEIVLRKPGSDHEFCAWIATHRANAELNLLFEDLATGKTVLQTCAFDPMKRGGQLESQYQSVAIPIPNMKAGVRISFSLSYKGITDDGTGHEPFLFIADPRIVKRSERSSILEPRLLLGKPGAPVETWLEAPLPDMLSPDSDAQIVSAEGATGFELCRHERCKLLENFGHSMILSSSHLVKAVLVIDGEPCSRVQLGKETIVRIPSKYLNGAKRHVCLKDETGSRILWETISLLPNFLTPADVMQRESAAPFASTLFPQSARRYESLKVRIGKASGSTDFEQLAHVIATLDGGYDNVRLHPLVFPDVEEPDVSVIIPAHNKVEVTYTALCSLLLAYNEASFEVIVVDDASSDETAELESIVSGIRVIHNETPQRFIRACNAGAEAARGKYLVLLNNDVEVTGGWLDELIGAFGRFRNVGLAGSKLLYPNGELQDAGGIIWGSGNPWNYGNRQNPEDPRFSYARQADYLSGAAMMVSAEVWKKVGGLSNYLEPMYFEDTDFAFKVREAGYTTWFVPSSVVYHYEGMTSGTDVTTGYKKYQEVNRPKFKRRWVKAFANNGAEGQTPDLEKDRGIVGRVLFVDYTTPRADRDAGSYAAIQEIRLVQSLGYKVTLLPMNIAHLGSYTEELQRMGVEVIYAPFFLSPTEYLESHAGDFDAFFITRYYVAQDILAKIKTHAPRAKVLFNNADLHFLREIRAAKAAGDDTLMARARKTRQEELEVIGKVDVVLSYNEIEHSVLEAYTEGAARVVKCPWVVETVSSVAPLKKRAGLSFLGSYRHHPNAEGIRWFVNDVMPVVQDVAGDVPLYIYGSGMPEDIKALAGPAVHPVGFVEDVADAYDRHRIFVAPLLSGAGIKGKVLGALAHGIPCVVSPTAAEGIGLRHKHDCFIVEKPEEWAEAIRQLMQDDKTWQSISQNALAYMKDSFSFEVGREKMRQAFEAADMFLSLD